MNVDEVVALGACLYAAYKSERQLSNPEEICRQAQRPEVTNECFGTISVDC